MLNAACQRCGRQYQLSGKALNDWANQQGGLAKTVRVMNGLWTLSNTSGQVSGRAGKQMQYARAEADQAKATAERDAAYTAVLCPSMECRSEEVLVESP